MLLYFVGVDRSTLRRPGLIVPQLNSFFYLRRGKSSNYVAADAIRDRYPCSSLFIDSGAFSAYNMKLTINLDDYIKYIHANIKHIDAYACLDVIGNAEATYKNYQEMQKQGLQPLPVFHCRSDVKWLHQFLAEGCEYIAIGGVAGNKELRNAFFTRVMPLMVDVDGRPKVKFHGFGMTDARYMRMFPWYSVDSAGWALMAGFGNIMYVLDDKRYGALGVSDQSPARKQAGRKHIERLMPGEQELFMRLFKEWGFTLAELQATAKHRRLWNLMAYTKLANSITDEKVVFKNAQEFFV